MAVTVLIPSPLRQFAGGAHAVQAAGPTVAAVLDGVVRAHPALREHLLIGPGRGDLPPFVHMFVNGQDVRGAGGLDSPVPDGGEVLIVQAISGG